MNTLHENILNEYQPDKNKYNKIYLQIIDKAMSENRFKNKNDYFEEHHILPKSIFPEFKTGHTWNLVLLTAREHYLSHYLLWKIYSKMKDDFKMNKMVMAILGMQAVNHQQDRFNSNLYERLKLSYKHSNSAKKKMSLNKKDKVLAIKNNKKILVDKYVFDNDPDMVGHTVGLVQAKRKDTGEHATVHKDIFDKDDNLIGVNAGVKRSEEFKRNLRMNYSGSNSAAAKRINIYDNNDNLVLETFGNFKNKCIENNLPCSALRKSYQRKSRIHYKDGCSKTKAIKSGNIKYQGWYAKIIDGVET